MHAHCMYHLCMYYVSMTGSRATPTVGYSARAVSADRSLYKTLVSCRDSNDSPRARTVAKKLSKMPGYCVSRDIFKDGDVLDREHDRYVCSECQLLLKDPVQLTRCGHRLCISCAEDILAGHAPAQCPRQDCKQDFAQKYGASVSLAMR